MTQKRKLTWADHQKLLEFLVDHNVKSASLHFKLSEGAVRNRLYTIRNKLKEEQTALNRIRNLQKISPRIRKYTTCGALLEDPIEEEG
jgi:hypothetical protein